MFSAHALYEGHGYARTVTDPLLSKLKFRLPACIAWVCYASSSTMWWFMHCFFLLSVSAYCIINVWGVGGGGAALGST